MATDTKMTPEEAKAFVFLKALERRAERAKERLKWHVRPTRKELEERRSKLS